MTEKNDKTILCVGACVLDIIHLLDEYPQEDTDTKSDNRKWQRGGNAANNTTVLSLLGAKTEYLGSLSTIAMFQFVIDDFNNYNINIKNCALHSNYEAPLSCVVLSRSTGTRTIVHSNPNLPAFTLTDFKKCNLKEYSWIHFGARAPLETLEMIDYVLEYNQKLGIENEKIIVSLDLEKKKEEFLELAKRNIDYIFLGKDFAQMIGSYEMNSAVYRLREIIKNKATIICPWGANGVAVLDSNDAFYTCTAFPPEIIVDTLGAGDTFCAGILYALANKNSLRAALEFASRLAGAKCGHYGYDDIRHYCAAIKEKTLTWFN